MSKETSTGRDSQQKTCKLDRESKLLYNNVNSNLNLITFMRKRKK